MSKKMSNVLFVCTGNCARSIIAEALLTVMSDGRFKGHSAGTRPGGLLNPFALEQVRKTGYPVESLRNKSWAEFAAPDAPEMDFIITVCRHAAAEPPPAWPGSPVCAHWGFEQPMSAAGSNGAKRGVFERLTQHIERRITAFLDLPHEKFDRPELHAQVHAIGRLS